MKKITGPALLAAVLLLAACGSDDSEAVDGANDTTETVEETTADAAPADTTADDTSDSAAEATADTV
ncbi:MAG: hypothetical protein AAGG08_10345, partial [Actinomycetota bacterium]